MNLTEHQRQQRNAKSRRWRERNLEASRQHTRAWKAKTIERIGLQRFRELARATKKAWMSVPENRMRHCLGQAKRRALAAGIPFTISMRDIPLPTYCPVLGIPINYKGTNKRGFINDSPSIDRIDPSQGYIPGNVMIISWRANRIKSDATLTELRAVLSYMERRCS